MQFGDPNTIYDYSENYLGYRILIKDEAAKKLLFDGTVSEHNKITHTLSVPVVDKSVFLGITHVTILLIADGEIITYKGTIRRGNVSNSIEIAFYRGTKNNKRAFRRYQVNGRAIVKGIVSGEQELKLRSSFEVSISDISRGGISIKTLSNYLQKDSVLKLSLLLEDSEFNLRCKVLRENKIGGNLSEYGCIFVEV